MKICSFIGILGLAGYGACSTEKWTEVRVKYSWNSLGLNKHAFFDVQSTLKEALAGQWKSTNVPNFLKLQAVSFGGDYAFTPLYDAKGFLAGAQFASAVDIIDSTGPPTFYPTASGTNEIITIDKKRYYASTFLFTNPATLKSGGRTSLYNGIIGDGLWVRNTSDPSGFNQIPDNLDDLLKKTLFTWQNCIPNMGIHYFYNMSRSFDCKKSYSWFLLGKGGSISGIGYYLFGDPSKLVKNRNWYDTVSRVAAKLITPLANDCVYDWIQDYGLASIHLYFTPAPWSIKCDQKHESVSPITLLSASQQLLSTAWESIFG